ncbi:MAG: extracellular solute-binding protein [Chloroflexota bacterium]|nr:extracellular solute-binding protein [Chloroflexota bacterium]
MNTQPLSRRAFLRLSSLAAGSLALAACTPAGQQAAAPNAEEGGALPAGALVEIEYASYDLGPANQAREAAATAFQAANPNIQVKLTVLPYGDLWEKINALMAAGTPPDAMYGDFSLLRHALEGRLLDLTDLFNADPVLSEPANFLTDLQDPLQAKYGTDKFLALLLGTWVPILYYNRDLFDAAGVPYPDQTWTWDKVREAGKALNQPQQEQWGFQWGTIFDNTGWLWWEHKPEDYWATPQIFPEKTTWDSPAGLGVMKIFADFAKDGAAIKPGEGEGFDNYAGAFGAGKVGMYAGGDWDAGWSFRDLPFQWDMTLIPMVIDGYRPALNTMVASNTLSATSQHPEEAWQWIRFMTADEQGATMIGIGAYETPVLKAAAHADAVLKPTWAVSGYANRVAAAELPGPMYTPYPLNINLWEFPGKFIDPTVEKVRLGEMTPEQAVAYLDSEGLPYFQQQHAETLEILQK